MRVAVAYNRPTEVVAGRPEDLKTDLQLESAAGFVADALAAAGHAVERIEADWDLLRACQAARPEIIFNLVEGFASTNAHEHIAPCIFDFLGIPYTGADPVNLLMIRDKVYTKDILRAHGFPMAPHRLLTRADDGVDELRFPLILKPVREEGSLGIQYDSVVRSPAELRERLHGLFAVFRQPILAEKFIVGRDRVQVSRHGPAALLPLVRVQVGGRARGDGRGVRSRPRDCRRPRVPCRQGAHDPALPRLQPRRFPRRGRRVDLFSRAQQQSGPRAEQRRLQQHLPADGRALRARLRDLDADDPHACGREVRRHGGNAMTSRRA
jgi:hypothetical protein